MASFDFDGDSVKAKFTLTPSPTGSPSSSTQSSTPKSVAPEPFSATAPGLGLNTIIGIPKATLSVATDILRSIPRGIISTAMSVAPKAVRSNIGNVNPAEDFGTVGRIALGTDPIFDIQTKAQGISHFLQQYGVAPKLSRSLGSFIGVGGTLLDAFPFGAPEKESIENAARLSARELAQYFAKTTDEKAIAGVLKILEHPDDTLLQTAESLARAKNTSEVNSILKKGVVLDDPKATLAAAEKRLGVKAVEQAPVDELRKLVGKPAIKPAPQAAAEGAKVGDLFPTIHEGGVVKMVPGEPVKILDGVETFVHPGDGGWIVSEKSTGRFLAESRSKEGALAKAKFNIDNVGKDTFVEMLKQNKLPSPTGTLDKAEPKLPVHVDVPNRVNTKLEQQASAATSYEEFYHRSGVTQESLDATAKKKGFKDAKDFYKHVKVEAFRAKTESGLGRRIALTSREKQLIAGEIQPGEKTTFRSAKEVIQERGAAAPTGAEGHTLERAAAEFLQRTDGKENFGKDVSLNKIIDEYRTPVEKKINLFDYIRTPEKVLTKIGLGPEAKFLRSQYEGYLKELPKNIETITGWVEQAKKAATGLKISPEEVNGRIFRFLDGQPVDLSAAEGKIAREVRTYLDNWADKLDLPKDKRIANYITHLFDDQLIKKEFDEDLAKIIADKIPGAVYDPFLEKRLGVLGYREDAWAALDAYTKRATRKLWMDPALRRIEDKAGSFEISQWNYVKRYLDQVNMRPTEIETLVDNSIKSVFGYKLGQRPFTRVTQKLRQMVYRGALGLNMGAAMRNLTQGVNTYAELGERYTAQGYIDLLRNGTAELKEVGLLGDDFIQDRTLSAVKNGLQKLDKGLFVFFDTAEKINRGSAYYGAKARALAQGLSEPQAIEAAKNLVRKTQFAFGRIDTPVALQSDLVKTLTQFQSFTVKQLEFLGGKVAKREWAGLARYVGGSAVMLATIGQLFGMKWQDIIPSFRFGVPPTLTVPAHVTADVTGKAEDKFGNKLDAAGMIKQIGNDLIPFIPAGVQGKKTIQGVSTVLKGKDTTASGRTRFKVPTNKVNLIRAAAFGKSNLPQAQEYYSKLGQSKAKSKAAVKYQF